MPISLSESLHLGKKEIIYSKPLKCCEQQPPILHMEILGLIFPTIKKLLLVVR
jgi:hypothetical protein